MIRIGRAMTATLALVLASLLIANALVAQTAPKPSAETTLFKNVAVFDGERSIGTTSVLISSGKIQSIGKSLAGDTNTIEIDGTGKTLLPGLIDSHTHVWFDTQLIQAAEFGVTTELDMMSNPDSIALLRKQQRQGAAHHRADVYSAGAAVTVAKGHGTQFEFPVPTLDSAGDAPKFVIDRVREGSDYIKIVYDDGTAWEVEPEIRLQSTGKQSSC